MPTSSGPNTLGESNLVFAIDTHDTSNGITPLGCGGFNGSTQGVKNVLTGTVYPFTNGMKLSGRDYYTSFAIDYPESSYGGDGAGRQGITQGYDVRSGGKLYDASRALHLWVYNNDTNSWIDNGATTYFRGARLGGHCYDNFTGAENGYLNEIALFISDYNTLKSTFPNCTFVVMGSHRADQYTAPLRAILYDLGMPTGYIDSDYIAAPEWILVGEPGLGTGNAFGWVYENYTTNAAQVAHINFGLPIKARGGMVFDGTNDYVDCGAIQPFDLSARNVTWEAVVKFNNTSGAEAIMTRWNNSTGEVWWFGRYDTTKIHVAFIIGGGYYGYYSDGNIGTSAGYYHVAVTLNNTVLSYYINGVLDSTDTVAAGTWTSDPDPNLLIGAQNQGAASNLNGEIPVAKIYNRALTAQEIKQNYQQYKTRFNLS